MVPGQFYKWRKTMLEAKRAGDFAVIRVTFEPGDATRYEYILIMSPKEILFGQGWNGKYKLMTINSGWSVAASYIKEKLELDERNGYDAYMASWFLHKYGKTLSMLDESHYKLTHERTDADKPEMLAFFTKRNFKTFMHEEEGL